MKRRHDCGEVKGEGGSSGADKLSPSNKKYVVILHFGVILFQNFYVVPPLTSQLRLTPSLFLFLFCFSFVFLRESPVCLFHQHRNNAQLHQDSDIRGSDPLFRLFDL